MANTARPEEVTQVAEELHRVQCHYNHIDQCFWFYGDSYKQDSHYAQKAEKMLTETPLTAEAICAVLKEI